MFRVSGLWCRVEEIPQGRRGLKREEAPHCLDHPCSRVEDLVFRIHSRLRSLSRVEFRVFSMLRVEGLLGV